MTESNRISETVVTGSSVVSGSDSRRLEARLGTSVGVAICDREAAVGGLYHILLPKPTGMVLTPEPEKYATTGIPLFIEKLCGAGASKDRMEATIAGGALVGKVSMDDLHMNIGGHITEIVEDILDREGITIRHSETGGYFSSLLDIDLMTWECHIKPIGYQRVSVETSITKATPEEIDNAIALVRPIPQVALKVIRMIHSNNYHMRDIAREVRQDQIISARILKVCNSAYCSPKTRINSIDQALSILGEKMILQLVVSASMEMFFKDFEHGYSLCRGGLFFHAIGTAFAAEKLSEMTKKDYPDIAYTAGLLHDIGKVVLDQFVGRSFPMFYRRLYEDEFSLIDVEEELIGCNHQVVGGRLAELWSLPEPLKEAILHHHNPEKSSVNPVLTHLVYIADLLISRFQVGNDLERIDATGLAESMEKLGLNLSDLPAIIEYIPWGELRKHSLYS